MALLGLRSPYQAKLGVVEEGARADLLLVDGDPATGIQLIANPELHFVVIMKDGRIYKDTRSQKAKRTRQHMPFLAPPRTLSVFRVSNLVFHEAICRVEHACAAGNSVADFDFARFRKRQ